MFVCLCEKSFEKVQSLNCHRRWCALVRGGEDKVNRKTNNGRPSEKKGKTLSSMYGDERAQQIKQQLAESMKVAERTPFCEQALLNISVAASNRETKHATWFKVGNIKVQGDWEKNVCEKLLQDGYSLKRHAIRYGKTHHYTPDVFVEELGIYIEVKGWMMHRDKQKYRKFCDEHQNLDIRLMLGDDYFRFLKGEIHLQELPLLKNSV